MSLFKKDKKEKAKLTVSSDELAFPEVHTGEVDETEPEEKDTEEIRYEGVAFPEIHIKKLEHKE